ncbi:MAG TPA: nitronate monooxygenase [Longimicrobiaceae bacterium]|nr:nitronate monooxygenase [Longimicrobiaceae bacterium]
MPPRRLHTRLTAAYGVEHPVAAAGMAFVGTAPDLAVAVCRAGAIGSLAIGPLPAEAARALIQAVRTQTDRPLNVNFITLFATEEHVRVCVEERVPIVSFHWGHPPRAWIDALHAGGAKVWEQVGSVEAARAAAADGVDLVIAQGTEAGGHNLGTLPTFVLVPAVVDAVGPETMVLAAGGISDGRQVAAALALGADGVWVGTRLVASEEAFAHPEYKERLVEAEGADTRLSPIFGPEMPHFNPMRVLENRVVREFTGREDEVPTDTSGEPVIGSTTFMGQQVDLRRFTNWVPVATTVGDLEEMPLLAGQGVGQVREVRPAAEIVRELVEEAAAVLFRLGVPAPGGVAVPRLADEPEAVPA